MASDYKDEPAITHNAVGPCGCAVCDPYCYLRRQERDNEAAAHLYRDKDGKLYAESERIG